MRQSLALNQAASSSSESDSESEGQYSDPPPGASMLVGAAAPPHGSAGEEEGRLYCLCQSPHDNVVGFDFTDILSCVIVTRTTVAERNDRVRRG